MLSADRLNAEIDPFKVGAWRKVSHLEWKSMRIAYRDMNFALNGWVSPSDFTMHVYGVETAAAAGAMVSGLQFSSAMARQGNGEVLWEWNNAACELNYHLVSNSTVRIPAVKMSGTLKTDGAAVYLKAHSLTLDRLAMQGELSFDGLQHRLKAEANVPMTRFRDYAEALPSGGGPEASQRRTVLAAVDGYLAARFSLSIPLRDIESLRLEASLNDSAWVGTRNSLAGIVPEDVPAFDHRKLDAAISRAILLSEDAGFWGHKGFDLEILRSALVDNLKEGRFVRGGGTISMQYVRNALGLRHRKTLLRKTEEVLWTVFLERGGVLGKEEIFNRYLAIIEWGPGVFGIEDAARFYFNTSPAGLTLDQGLFLASIIPNPRMFATQLFPDGSLRPFAEAYHESMRWMLYEEGLIDEAVLDSPLPRFPSVMRRAGRSS